MKELEKVAQSYGLKEIWAEVSITAIPLFESKGFKVTRVYTKKVMDTEFEDRIMTKKLSF